MNEKIDCLYSVHCSICTKKLSNKKLRKLAILPLKLIKIGYLWNLKFHSKYLHKHPILSNSILAKGTFNDYEDK